MKVSIAQYPPCCDIDKSKDTIFKTLKKVSENKCADNMDYVRFLRPELYK